MKLYTTNLWGERIDTPQLKAVKRVVLFVPMYFRCLFEGIAEFMVIMNKRIKEAWKLSLKGTVARTKTETDYVIHFGRNRVVIKYNDRPLANPHYYNMGKIEDRAEDWFDTTVINKENKKAYNDKVKALNTMESWAKVNSQRFIKSKDTAFDFNKARSDLRNM